MVHGCPRNLIFMTANKSRPAKSQVGFFVQCRQSPGSNGICMLISSLKRQLLREKRRAQKKGQLSAESCRQTVTVPWTASLRVNIIPNNKHHPAGGVYYLVALRRFVCIFISEGNENKGVAAVQPAAINSPLDWQGICKGWFPRLHRTKGPLV